MKRATTLFLALAMGTLLAQSALAANAVRISQQYGSGGNAGAVYNQDYVELFNNSGSAVNIGGWSLQYGAATGTVGFGGASGQVTVFASGTTIAACGYLLVSIGTTGANGIALPTPDVVGNAGTNMSGTQGKIALLSVSSFPTACSGNSTGGAFVDVLGYGATANCFETSAAPATTASTAATRGGGGVTDTDNNSTNFTSVAPSPRNSSSPKNATCLVTPANSSTWGQLKLLYR